MAVNCPQHVIDGSIKDLTAAELNDPDLFFHNNTKDFIYSNLDPATFEAFLGAMKTKEDGSTCSHENLRKFVDAVKWGASQRNVSLPRDFFAVTDSHLASFKEELAKAKQEKASALHSFLACAV